MALINKLSAIGNAIREKTGKVDLLTLDQMPEEISGIETGGDTSMEDTIVSGSFIDTYTNNRITEVGFYTFRRYPIRVFNSTSVKKLGGQSFYESTILEECNIPNVTTIGSFQACSSLKRVYFPKLIGGVGSNSFNGCTSLTYAHIGKVANIGNSVFVNCNNLKTVIITKDSVSNLMNVNSFTNSAIANGTGYIYVPDDLVESYKKATNWSTYADQIKPISELPTEGG